MNSSISQIKSIEISLESFIKNWNRRQKWKAFFGCRSSWKGNDGYNEEEECSWRVRLSNFLDSFEVHIFTIVLLLTDILFTSLELSSSALSSCPENYSTTKEEVWFIGWGLRFCASFCLRSVALFVGLGGSFFRSLGHVLDGVVMVVALFLESFLERRGGALVVVVSLWRIVRVVESAFELSDEAIEAKIEVIVRQFQNLQDENARLLEIIVEKDLTIERLEEELRVYDHQQSRFDEVLEAT